MLRQPVRVMVLALVLVPIVMAAYWMRDASWPVGLQQMAAGCVVVAETFYHVLKMVVGWSPISMSWIGLPHVALDFWLTVYLMGLFVAVPSELLGNWLANLGSRRENGISKG